MILAIDVGNSRVKWGVYTKNKWLAHGACEISAVENIKSDWQQLLSSSPKTIIISNVAGDEVRTRLMKLISHWNVTPTWIKSQQQQAGVINNYAEPATLGSDRWAALIAAKQMSPIACVVVNVGTATTIDMLSSAGEFLGGVIVPGPKVLQQALIQNTAAIKIGAGQFQQLPKNTSDAVITGTIHASCGAIERMVDILMQITETRPLCVVSGGAAGSIIPYLNFPVRHVENLVLDGLICIAKELNQS